MEVDKTQIGKDDFLRLLRDRRSPPAAGRVAIPGALTQGRLWSGCGVRGQRSRRPVGARQLPPAGVGLVQGDCLDHGRRRRPRRGCRQKPRGPWHPGGRNRHTRARAALPAQRRLLRARCDIEGRRARGRGQGAA